MTSTLGRRLALLLGVTYVGFGIAELIAHLDDSAASLLFWVVSLLGGGALVLGGLLMARRSRDLGRALVTVGAAFGMVATMWTVLVPAIAVIVIALTLREPHPIAH